MPRYFSIGETADYFGVSVDTIRRWEAEGKITSVRTKGGHRRFLASALAGEEEKERNEKPTLCYARVSTRDKKEDLERQANALIAVNLVIIAVYKFSTQVYGQVHPSHARD